jgi:hypothetical protein
MFKRLSTFTLLAIMVFSSGLALAQQATSTLLQKANSAHLSNDNIAALYALWDAEQELWNQTTALGVRNVFFLKDQPLGFGFFTPKQGEDFFIGETLLFYCELFGYTRSKTADGTYNDGVSVVFRILDGNGAPVSNEFSSGSSGNQGYRSLDVGLMSFSTVKIGGLDPGSYKLQVTLTDVYDQTKSVQLEKPFNLLPNPNQESEE